MDLVIKPTKYVAGEITAPPSKSYTHRYMYIALLSKGETSITNPLKANDTKATLESITGFGATASWNRVLSDGSPKEPKQPIYAYRSGTTARFSCSVASLVDGETHIDGDSQLRKRPMKPIIDALTQIGIHIESNSYRLPIKILGGRITRKAVDIDASISSQFVSALLISGSRIGLEIHTKGEPVSRNYIDITIKCLREAGVKVYRDDYNLFHVEATEPKGKIYTVPGDYSSAAFFIVAAAISGEIVVKGLNLDDIQPDKKIVDIVTEAGASIEYKRGSIRVEMGRLEGFETDLRDAPDLLPITSVLAAYSNGKSIIHGVKHARYKESDRLESVAKNLKAMGVDVKTDEDKLIIYGRGDKGIKGGLLNSFNDHRIAMAFAIAAIHAETPSVLMGASIIDDSYPGFINDLIKIGGWVTKI